MGSAFSGCTPAGVEQKEMQHEETKMRCTKLFVMILAVGMAIASAAAAADALPPWRDGKAKQAIVRFVEDVTKKGGTAFIPPAERIREYAYDRESSIGRLDKALEEAKVEGWTVVDMKKDWRHIFPFEK
jgi:hypothetical protein